MPKSEDPEDDREAQIRDMLLPNVESARAEADSYLQQAVRMVRQSIVICERTNGIDSHDAIQQYTDLGLLEHAAGNVDLGLKLSKHAMDLWSASYGPAHPSVVSILVCRILPSKVCAETNGSARTEQRRCDRATNVGTPGGSAARSRAPKARRDCPRSRLGRGRPSRSHPRSSVRSPVRPRQVSRDDEVWSRHPLEAPRRGSEGSCGSVKLDQVYRAIRRPRRHGATSSRGTPQEIPANLGQQAERPSSGKRRRGSRLCSSAEWSGFYCCSSRARSKGQLERRRARRLHSGLEGFVQVKVRQPQTQAYSLIFVSTLLAAPHRNMLLPLLHPALTFFCSRDINHPSRPRSRPCHYSILPTLLKICMLDAESFAILIIQEQTVWLVREVSVSSNLACVVVVKAEPRIPRGHRARARENRTSSSRLSSLFLPLPSSFHHCASSPCERSQRVSTSQGLDVPRCHLGVLRVGDPRQENSAVRD